MRIMGLDLGSKRIGVSLSDELGLTAQPRETIVRTSLAADLKRLVAIAEENSVEKVVVGLPLNMNGTEGPQARRVKKFVERLRQKTPLTVETWDERLSTVAVTRVLIDADVGRAGRRAVVDKLAASYILQGWLDRHGKGEPDAVASTGIGDE